MAQWRDGLSSKNWVQSLPWSSRATLESLIKKESSLTRTVTTIDWTWNVLHRPTSLRLGLHLGAVGRCGPFKRRNLVRGILVTGVCPWTEHWNLNPFSLPLFCFPATKLAVLPCHVLLPGCAASQWAQSSGTDHSCTEISELLATIKLFLNWFISGIYCINRRLINTVAIPDMPHNASGDNEAKRWGVVH